MQRRITSCHLKHCGAIKELCNAYIFQKSLSPAGLDHKLTSKVRDRAWFKRSQLNRFIEGISRYDIPVRELREDHGLSDCVSPQISLEAKAFNGWDFYLQGVEGRPGLGFLKYNMSSSSNEYIVYSLNGVLGAVNLCKIDRFHHSWRAKQEGTIADSSCCGNNLTSTSIDWLGSERAA